MPGPSEPPAVLGLTDHVEQPAAPGEQRWSVRRGGEALVLHVGHELRRGGRARREVDARLAALRGLADAPGLDPVLDGGVADGRVWWLTRPATSDREPATSGARSVDDAVRIAVDLAAGLARLHGAGLVSGTVTPAAVVATGDGARLAVSPVPPTPPVPGSGSAPLHVPPEVLEGREWTPAADVWGLTSTLHVLLEGRAPFAREAEQGPAELLLAITLGERVRFHRPDVGEPLRRVVDRGLDPDPARRPTAAALGAAIVTATGAPLADRLDTVAPGATPPSLDDLDGGDDGSSPVGRPLGSAYVLVEPIGRGGMGRVWRGVRRADGSAVAVKVLRPELADDPDQVARFLTERSSLRAVVDDRVVRVHDLVVEGSVLAIVMDLVAGDDLRTVLRREERFAPGRAVELLEGVAGGLAAVHAAGIVHRDVKPENVLVPRDPQPGAPVKLTDFGIARVVDGANLTRPTQLVGTPDYVAPELAAGRQPSPAADVYALGIVAYELLTGRRPFVGPTPAAVLRAHLDAEPVPPPGLDGTVWGILAACLAKDPAARPDAATLAGWLRSAGPLVADAPRLAPLPEVAAADPAGGWSAFAPPGAASAAPAGVAAGFVGGAPGGPAVPAPAPVALADPLARGDGPADDDRTATRAGIPLAEPEAPAPVRRNRRPLYLALALACLVLVVAGWFTARRDRGATDAAGPAGTTTTTTAPGRILYLPFRELGRTEEGARIGLRLPDTLGGDRFSDVAEVRVSVFPAGQDETTSEPLVRAYFDPDSGTSDSGDVLSLDQLPEGDPDGVIDTLSVVAEPGQCVLVEVPYEGDDLLPAEQGFPEAPDHCKDLES